MNARHREVRMVACVSLDGYIADRSGSCAQEAHDGWTSAEDKREFWREVEDCDVIVAGRNALDHMPVGRVHRPTAMLSRSPEEPLTGRWDVDWVVNPHPGDVRDFLESRGGRRFLVCGGSMTYDLFLRWNLVDYMVLVVEPVTLGRGVRLRTPPPTRGGMDVSRFSLIKARPLNARGTLRLDLRRAKTW